MRILPYIYNHSAWQSKAKAWTEKTGLRRDYAREAIGTASGKQVYGLGNRDNFIKTVGDIDDKNSKITYMDKKTADECKNFLQENFGIKANYDKVDVGIANGINKTVSDVTNEFGKDFLSELKEIRFVTQKELGDENAVAAYNAKEKVIKIPVNTTIETMQKLAKTQQGNWSTNSKYHLIKHEIGHALETYLKKNNKTMYEKIETLWFFTTRSNGFDKNTEKELLSNYGFSDTSEMIAEAIAEYMNKNPRYYSIRIANMLKQGIKNAINN